MSKKSVFLEVDTSIRDKNLLIAKNSDEEEEFHKFLNSTGIGQLPSITVKPTPGFCVKSHEKNGKKVFINFCQTDKIPAPKDITESELVELLDTDEICDFRVPMSIGAVRVEENKDQDVNVCDIAVNSEFMKKCNEIQSFKEFLIAVAFEGYQSKFDVDLQSDRIVLKNKKVMGTLQVHHIQQRDVDQKMNAGKLPKLDEIGPDSGARIPDNEKDSKMKIQVIEETTTTEPKHRFFKKKNVKGILFGEFYMPYVTSAKDIKLDIGEDRLIVEATNGKYFLDTFHEYKVNREGATSDYNLATKFLTISMPIIA